MNRIRAFNRYYTKVLGLMNRCYLGSEFGFPEVRIIQDIYLHPHRTSKMIATELNMDKGLLSRLLKQLEHGGYIFRKEDEKDSRVALIELTEKGTEAYHRLDAAASKSVEEMLSHLTDEQLQELVKNMDLIYNMISDGRKESTY